MLQASKLIDTHKFLVVFVACGGGSEVNDPALDLEAGGGLVVVVTCYIAISASVSSEGSGR